MSNDQGYGRVDTTGPRERAASPPASTEALAGHCNGLAEQGQNSFGNNSLVLISKVPTKRRDKDYSIAFAILLVMMLVLSLVVNRGDFSTSFVATSAYGQTGSWVSLAMIATMLGTFLGMMLSVVVYFADLREQIMNTSIAVAVVLQVIIASIIFVADDWLFLAVLCLLSAVVDLIKFGKAKRYMTISSELVQMAIDVNFRFGASVVVFVICAGAAQCCVLLWWSASFVELMSAELSAGIFILGCMFIFCFYWIVQFFHALVSCVVSGCLLWYFCDAENSMDTSVASAAAGASTHVMLYTKCALSSSLGSLCKAALFGPISHIIISLLHWCREHDPFGGPIHSMLRVIVAKLVRPFEPFALRYNRLSMGYVAIL